MAGRNATAGRQGASEGEALADEATRQQREPARKDHGVGKDHSNQGGGYDGGDPDAEIQRLAAEDAANQKRAAEQAERQRIAEAERRQAEGR